ncbi:MAG: bifunctional enoyl-CoA hydratase/phosphate acetyltransferase [Burkholderiaceae bacterium]
MSSTDAYQHFARLQAACETQAPLPTAVACPNNEPAMAGVMEAVDAGLIAPVLVGEPDRIAAACTALQIKPDRFPVIAAQGEAESAARAVEQVHLGNAAAVMKGNLHSDVLLGAVVKREIGLRTDKRLSHIFVTDMPGYERLIAVTDGALNIAPDVASRADIIENAGLLAKAYGVETPNVAVMSAVETVNTAIQSSVDAQTLTDMASEGRFAGLNVHGPLAMDNAISLEAARIKGIQAHVAGRADILAVPTIECGNMVVKALTFIAGADAAGIVMGAKVPVMLTSRADSPLARRMSCVLAVLVAHYQATGQSLVSS